MNKFITSDNGGLPIQLDDFRFIDDSVRNVLLGIMSAYGISKDESFILSGAGSTLNGGNFDIAAGYISLEGEILEVEAHSITTTLGAGEEHVWQLQTSNDPAGLKTFESTSSFDTYQVRQAQVVVEVPSGVFMPMLAPTIHQRMAANGFGTILQTKVIEIGTWDMDADATKNVAHGITFGFNLQQKIRAIDVIILQDGAGLSYPLNRFEVGGLIAGGIVQISASEINLQRETSGAFDSPLYDDAVINRGWVTIQYEL